MDRVRGVDAAVGVGDVAAGLGLQLAGDPQGAATSCAVVAVSLTVALHFETGYLALLPLLLWPLVSRRRSPFVAGRAAVVLGGGARRVPRG